MIEARDLETSVSRRNLLIGAAAAGTLTTVCPRALARVRTEAGFRSALSLSPFAEPMLAKLSFSDGKRVARTAEALQRMFLEHGATEVYARFGTRRKFTPGEGDHSVERGLERARMAKTLGLPFNPELGLFAYYGDVTHQPEPDFSDYPEIKLPGPWHTLTIAQMVVPLRIYGALMAKEILATGAQVNYWDLGNEVDFGVAGVSIPPLRMPNGWVYRPPDAVDPELGKMNFGVYLRLSEIEQRAWLSKHLWPHVGKLFAAVAEGIRSVDPHARFSTHLSGLAAYSPRFVIDFFEAMDANGFVVAQPGLSYYPTSSNATPDRFNRFKAMATEASAALKRPIFVAEYSYAVGPFKFGNDDWANGVDPYPISREGQAAFLRDLVAWGASSGHLSGIRPWAPDFALPGWGEMSFFDVKGDVAVARPALDSITNGLADARTRPKASA